MAILLKLCRRNTELAFQDVQIQAFMLTKKVGYKILIRIRYQVKKGDFSQIEDILYQWVTNARLANLPLTDDVLTEKAKQVADRMGENFKVSVGWLIRFKKGLEFRGKD